MVLDIANLDFAYGEQLVLKHLNLTMEAGSTLGIIGPNGGGKTTLIKLLMGILNPTRGSLQVAGMTPIDAVRRGDVIGYLPQNTNVPSNFPINVRQVIRLGLAGKTGMLRSHPQEDLDFVETLIERVGVKELVEQPVGELSGGQLQRVFIARALAARPKLLLLDEPTTGIDRSGQERFLDFIRALRREMNLSVVFVSHDLRAVSAISDRIGCLNVTLHYHDVPERMPRELAHEMFACDLEAMGIGAPKNDEYVPLRVKDQTINHEDAKARSGS